MHKNPVGGGKTLVNTVLAAHCTTRKSTRSSRAIRAALAIVTAALLFVCGLFGGLSRMPLVGGMLKPMTVYAADVRVIIEPIPNDPSYYSVTYSNSYLIPQIIVKGQDQNLYDILDRSAATPALPPNEPWNVTLQLQTDVEIGKLSYDKGDLRIIGTGKKLTCNGNDCGIHISSGNLILDGVTVIANAGTGGTNQNGVLVQQGASGTGGELSIGNGGSLTASGNDTGVAANKMTIDSFSAVKAVSGNGAGICVNESLTIWSGATVEASGETYGIEVTGGNLTVEDGANVKAEGKSGAFYAPSGSITAPGYTPGDPSYTSGKFAPAPAITTTSLPDGTVGTAYSATLAASGFSSTPGWSVSNGSLPAGLTLDSTSGVISGTPSAEGTVSFTVEAKGGPNIAKKAFTITVKASGGGTPTPTPAPAAPASSCANGHASYTWQTVTEPDVHNDGEEICVCEGCGQVLYRVPLSAYGPFQKVTAEKIRNAAQGATMEITTSRWYSFHKSVMEALAARPDVTLVVSFLREGYKGERLVFTIPAGTDTIALLNEEGYAGFFYISWKLGTLRPAN